jgi:hypothetical protein
MGSNERVNMYAGIKLKAILTRPSTDGDYAVKTDVPSTNQYHCTYPRYVIWGDCIYKLVYVQGSAPHLIGVYEWESKQYEVIC